MPSDNKIIFSTFGTIAKFMSMPTPKGLRIYLLFRDGEFIDVWSNLKQLSIDMNQEKLPFVSYSKLSKMSKEDGLIEFSKRDHQFKILVRKVR